MQAFTNKINANGWLHANLGQIRDPLW